jgi:prepilin-type N-terminal cleavage/methylation domain-containing protein
MRPSKKCQTPWTGFTLVELLISIAILAMGSVLLTQALARGAHALVLAHHRATAHSFAAAKMADLELGLRYGAEIKPSGQFGAGRNRFTWQVERTAADLPDLELVTLTVGWKQGRHDHYARFSAVHKIPDAEAQE